MAVLTGSISAIGAFLSIIIVTLNIIFIISIIKRKKRESNRVYVLNKRVRVKEAPSSAKTNFMRTIANERSFSSTSHTSSTLSEVTLSSKASLDATQLGLTNTDNDIMLGPRKNRVLSPLPGSSKKILTEEKGSLVPLPPIADSLVDYQDPLMGTYTAEKDTKNDKNSVTIISAGTNISHPDSGEGEDIIFHAPTSEERNDLAKKQNKSDISVVTIEGACV